MAVIYLRHAVHGTKVACSDGEAAADCANGWQRYSLDEPVEPVVEKGFPVDTPLNAFVPIVTDLEELRARYLEKFGVKPHHRKTAETLAAELSNG